jgi:hypothetical protein
MSEDVTLDDVTVDDVTLDNGSDVPPIAKAERHHREGREGLQRLVLQSGRATATAG